MHGVRCRAVFDGNGRLDFHKLPWLRCWAILFRGGSDELHVVCCGSLLAVYWNASILLVLFLCRRLVLVSLGLCWVYRMRSGAILGEFKRIHVGNVCSMFSGTVRCADGLYRVRILQRRLVRFDIWCYLFVDV